MTIVSVKRLARSRELTLPLSVKLVRQLILATALLLHVCKGAPHEVRDARLLRALRNCSTVLQLVRPDGVKVCHLQSKNQIAVLNGCSEGPLR